MADHFNRIADSAPGPDFVVHRVPAFKIFTGHAENGVFTVRHKFGLQGIYQGVKKIEDYRFE
ncbi:hypothetical protein AGMMS49936_04960 [Endomicrobiia bacterium]|nr:hypothetical protein AGMMS49936_04960 [Endomicrobiia bacterium]